jgi:hypothetical protein
MIDAIKTMVEIDSNSPLAQIINKSDYTPLEWKGVDFYPSGQHHYTGEKTSIWASGLGNLQLKFSKGYHPKFWLSNSLHKFSTKGVNHTDFTKSNLVKTIERLSSILSIAPNELNLQGKIEFSVNIPVSDANGIIEALTMYKNVELENMKRGHQNYGKKAFLSKYHVKLYNPLKKLKGEDPEVFKEMGITEDNNLLRYEIVAQMSYVQKQWGIPLSNLQDIQEQSTLEAIGNTLSSLAKYLYFKPQFPEDLKPQDLQKYYYFMDAPKANITHFRKNNNSTYKRHRAIYNKLRKQYSKPYDMSALVAQKWEHLIAN